VCVLVKCAVLYSPPVSREAVEVEHVAYTRCWVRACGGRTSTGHKRASFIVVARTRTNSARRWDVLVVPCWGRGLVVCGEHRVSI